METVVIGGGIAGLCTAFHLVRQGKRVTLIDKGLLGNGASNKAAGMITPASEVHPGEDDLMACFLKCTAYYPEFVNDLTGRQPRDVDYRQNGSLMCALDSDGERELMRLYEFQKNMGLETVPISQKELAGQEPFLSPRVRTAVFAKNEACVDTERLLQALRLRVTESGLCRVIENSCCSRLKLENERVVGVVLGGECGETLRAERVVLTTGFSAETLEDQVGVRLPLRPVRGQVLAIRARKDTIQRPVRIYHRYPIYLVPRSDGRIVIGATSEELSEETVTAGGLLDLIYAAWQVLPLIYDCPVVETRVGFRPATSDHRPVIGPTRIQNLFVFNGLYRHGIMAAPFLAKQLVTLMEGGVPEPDLTPFGLERFHQ